GNLEEIKRILEGVGLKANLFFGVYGQAADLENAKNAAVSIVFSRWGELPAKVLKDNHNVPFIIEQALPANFSEERQLLGKLVDYADIDETAIDGFIKAEEAYEKNYLSRIRNDIFELNHGRRAVLVGDEEQVIRYGKILKRTFGIKPFAAVITDANRKDEEHITDNTDVLKEIAEDFYITSDQKDIDDIIRRSGADIIIGSSLENPSAEKLGASLIEVSYPIYHKSILNQPTACVRGQIRFVQEYISVIKSNDIKKKVELKNVLYATDLFGKILSSY
ncbi:MAG: nitrogenase molybdenum-iron protein, partial [Pseudobutyrivibrio sp.]|nr:nitrogenase molybdenum-iron protein [Pseudobutyrivibrio sp.]